jgi:hypothetical protein
VQEVLCHKKERSLYELTKRRYCGQELPVRLDYSRFETTAPASGSAEEDAAAPDVNELTENREETSHHKSGHQIT